MANVTFTTTKKVNVGVKVKKPVKPINHSPKPSKARAKLSASQEYKLQKAALKNARKQAKWDYKTEKLRVKGAPSKIESIGKAFAEGSAPIAGSITANRAIEQMEAGKAARTQAEMSNNQLASWQQVISGNPDKEKGADGETQGRSTTTSTSGGSIFGG